MQATSDDRITYDIICDIVYDITLRIVYDVVYTYNVVYNIPYTILYTISYTIYTVKFIPAAALQQRPSDGASRFQPPDSWTRRVELWYAGSKSCSTASAEDGPEHFPRGRHRQLEARRLPTRTAWEFHSSACSCLWVEKFVQMF
jgi:hypothetical protein